ncbi:hypothetical protein [Streptomyces sp. NPDC017941]|uniref:hypothetical protein n=1 Tax=unclassified Streptomyces TaxID=2593676 RepID=UPI0037A330DB
MRYETAPRDAAARVWRSRNPRAVKPRCPRGPLPRPRALRAVARLSARAVHTALAVLTALTVLTVASCASPVRTASMPPNDVIRTAQRDLTEDCLTRQGLTPPRPGARPSPAARQQRVTRALFGTGRTELSLTLPTGYSVRAHTDGCLAAAQRTLYGDQRRWFRVSTVVNNLKPEASFRKEPLSEVRARHRADLAEWRRLRARALVNAKAHLQAVGHRAAAR